LQNSEAGNQVDRLPVVPFPSTPTAMIATTDAQGVVTAVAVLVMAPSADGKEQAVGGTIVSLPTSVNTSGGGEAARPLASSLAEGGEERLLADVESASRVTVNYHAVFDQDQMTAWMSRIGPLRVSLPNDVVTVNDAGDAVTLFAAGQQTLQPADVAAVLALAKKKGLEAN
ncbi:MAG TPA: hypothetical protein PLV68_20270, partial [Ilumatobacteraceae bacterium]|nr:hypothetical protein [Ilumatobacteraceae bacterium]